MHLTRALTAAAVLAGSALAQPVRWPNLDLFGGYQGWSLRRSDFQSRPGGELSSGGVFGVRAGYGLNAHWSLEGAYTFARNDLRLLRDQPPLSFGVQSHHLSINPLRYFRAPDDRLRPYLTAGVGLIWYRPTEAARRDVGLPVNWGGGVSSIQTERKLAFNWGGGMTVAITQLVQLRFDARNVLSGQPHLGFPPEAVIPGGAYLSPGGIASGLQATAGIGFNFSGTGDRAASISNPPSPPPSPRASRAAKTLRVNLAGGMTPIRPTGEVKFVATTDAPDPLAVKYSWTVNALAAEASGSRFVFSGKGREPGDYKVCGTATTPNRDWTPGSDCYTVTIEPLPRVKANISEPVRINSGETTRFTATTDASPDEPVAYEWTLNGRPITNTGPVLTFNSEGRQPAVYDVCVIATARGQASEKQCSSANVVPCTSPAISIGTLPAAEVFAGERVNIPVVVHPGSCGSPVRVAYRAGDGVISGSGGTGVLDTTNVAFDRTNRSKLQRRSVPVTAIATDDRGNTATAQANIIVKLAAAAQRLDDVLFASGRSRVNNCGKRVLLEMLMPRLADDPEAQVVLVGHVDETENGSVAVAKSRRGKKGRSAATGLDRARVLNAAAVISSGTGICPSLELSRVKVAYAGKTKGSQLRPTFCGSSTEVLAGRRKSAKSDARAPFRRVEVWIVPQGAPMPPGVTVQDAPAAAVKALKCPK